MALRRALYRLHAMLKVHLAEEELYLGVLDRHLRRGEGRAWRRASTTRSPSRSSRRVGAGPSSRRGDPFEVPGVELGDEPRALLHDRRPLVERRVARLRQLVVATLRARPVPPTMTR